MRASLLSYVEDLPGYSGRLAYVWREGVRWRTRTYDELHRRAHSCAEGLARAGLRRGGHVLIQGPDTADWVEGLFGILLAGGVGVPLEAASPPLLVEKVAAKTGARLLVAPTGANPPGGLTLVPMGGWSGGSRDVIPAPVTHPAPGDPAEILFTSGTTGDPKGVVLTHGNLVSDFAPIERGYARREHIVRWFPQLRFLSTLPMSHMFGQAMNIFLGLGFGLTIVLAPARPAELPGTARFHGTWGLFTVPRILDLMAAEVRRRMKESGRLERFEARQEELAARPWYRQAPAFWRVQRMLGWRFRLIVVGGAALPDATRRFWERCGFLVVQGYGLTEAAPIVSLSNPFDRRRADIGRPLGGQEVRIGPDGEVLVRGGNVSPGYLGAPPAATQEWLRTGDAGELDASGRLIIRGRIKDVIVTPEGENVHPEDVEAAFAGAPGVREACVIGLSRDGQERPHAVLLMEPGSDPQAAVSIANARLMPRQRVRGHTVWPETDLPRTAIGKVRKGLVRERILAAMRGEESGASPSTGSGARRLVAQVARKRAEEIPATARLEEDLGLGSLDLVELAVALEEEYGIALPESRLAQATVSEIDGLIAGAAAGGAARTPPQSPSPMTRPDVPAPSVEERAPRAWGRLPPMPRWARSLPAHLLRRILEEILYVPLVRLMARPRVEGMENLAGADHPLLFVANHRSHIDGGLLKTLLPMRLRGRIAPGMTTRHHGVYFGHRPMRRWRYFVERVEVSLVQLLFHAWPVPETGGLRESLLYAGELADAGFSLLIFPEGRHVAEGSIEPFRAGIGLYARELRMPIVPVYLEGTARVLPPTSWVPRVARTRLVVGRPMTVPPDADPAGTARAIEREVRRLAGDAAAQKSNPSFGKPT